MKASGSFVLLVVLGASVLVSTLPGTAALPREGMDQGWMQPGFTVVFAGSDHRSGPLPPTPANLWDPAGWTRLTATVTSVSAEARAVTVQYEGCVAASSVYDLLWNAEAMTCRAGVETYSLDTRRSVDGAHCAVLWIAEADLRGEGACVGEKTVHEVMLLPDDVVVLSEETREYCPVGGGWVPCAWMPRSSYVYDLGTGLLLDAKDVVVQATRVSASHA